MALRVLQINGVMDRAGVETWLMHMLRRLDRREIAMDFVVQTDRPGSYDAEIRSLGARLTPCVKSWGPWHYARRLGRILRESGPYDVVHSQSYFFSGVDLRVAAEAGVGMRIAHIHPYQYLREGWMLNPFYRGLMSRWIQTYSTNILAPSNATIGNFGKFVDLSAKPWAVIRNCVDLGVYRAGFDRNAARKELGLPTDRPVVIYVARFAPHKNHRLVPKVAERLGLPAHFVLAGTDGPTRRQVQKQVASRGDFSVLTDVEDVAKLLRCSDVFLFPSLEEGFGTVAIEAAAAGLPVVATDLPPIREACAPSHWEYAFPANDVEAAAKSVRTILTDGDLRLRLEEDGREWAEKFSIEPVLEQLRCIYRSGGRR